LITSVERVFFSIDQEIPDPLTKQNARVFYFLLKKALHDRNFEPLPHCFARLRKTKMQKADRVLFDALEIWFHLLHKQLKMAENILRTNPSIFLTQDTSPLHFPFGTWLYLAKGPKAAKKHFASALETPYPPTTALPSLFLSEQIDDKQGWIERALWWEKKELYRQLELFKSAIGKNKHD